MKKLRSPLVFPDNEGAYLFAASFVARPKGWITGICFCTQRPARAERVIEYQVGGTGAREQSGPVHPSVQSQWLHEL